MQRVRVISVKPVRDFWHAHPDAESSLKYWIKATRLGSWKKLSDVRATFNSADVYQDWTIFNIGGNKYRLIVNINYGTGIVYVHHILTHKEYDAGGWKT
jgi:mRNA interferase HigB